MRTGRLGGAATSVPVPRLEDAGIATVPVKGIADLIRAFEAGREGIWNAVEIRYARRIVNNAERTAEHGFSPWRIGKSDLWAKVGSVLIFLEAVAAVLGINESTRDSERGIDGLKVVVCPGTVFLVEAEVVIPTQTKAQREVMANLVAILSKERHALVPPVQIEGRGRAGCFYLAQQKAGKSKANLVAVALTRCAGGIVRKTEGECSRVAMAVDLLSMKIAAERDIVSSLRPGYGVANDGGGTDIISLKSIAQAGFSVSSGVAE